MVPGHEIVGRVVRVGSEVKKLKAGDFAGVGCLVDSCRHCFACDEGLEQYCEHIPTVTYNGRERDSGRPTYGGYSEQIVVEERFVVKIPPTLDLKAQRRCYAPASPPIRHYVTGRSAPARRSASLVLAASVTWA